LPLKNCLNIVGVQGEDNSPWVGVLIIVGVVGEAIAFASGFACGTAVGVMACAGGRSYFCSCSKYASAVGTPPQQTSKVFVLALTNCTREGAGGFSVSKNHRSLKHTCKVKYSFHEIGKL